MRPPTLSHRVVELLRKNHRPGEHLTDDEIGSILQAEFGTSTTNFPAAVASYRLRWNKGLLPTMDGVAPKRKLGEFVQVWGGEMDGRKKLLIRVELPVGAKGPRKELAEKLVAALA